MNLSLLFSTSSEIEQPFSFLTDYFLTWVSYLYYAVLQVLTEMHVKSFMKQLLEGIHYLHTNKILHRDIKGANLLVTRDNVLKIADWGLARSWRSPDQR